MLDTNRLPALVFTGRYPTVFHSYDPTTDLVKAYSADTFIFLEELLPMITNIIYFDELHEKFPERFI